MRICHVKTPIRHRICLHPKAKGVLHESNVKFSRGSRLSTKLLIFKTRKNLIDFGVNVLGKERASKDTRAICWTLEHVREAFNKDGSTAWIRRMVDPRFVCIIGFVKDDISANTLTHECVHAAFSWLRRTRRKSWPDDDFEEERIAYPAGILANVVNNLAIEDGMYQPGQLLAQEPC